MSLDDHVIKINLAKNKIKNSIFEMAEAITNALNQLENSQAKAQKLGMSKALFQNGTQLVLTIILWK